METAATATAELTAAITTTWRYDDVRISQGCPAHRAAHRSTRLPTPLALP